MKNLLFICLLIPAQLFAQNNIPRNEGGFNIGNVFFPEYDQFDAALKPTVRLSYLRNFGRTQVGISVEGNSYGYAGMVLGAGFILDVPRPYLYSLSPAILFNRKFNYCKGYIFAGGAAGYYFSHQTEGSSGVYYDGHGFSLRVQTGFTYDIGKNLSLNTEIAARLAGVWSKQKPMPGCGVGITEETIFPEHYIVKNAYIHIPVTLGVRYRF